MMPILNQRLNNAKQELEQLLFFFAPYIKEHEKLTLIHIYTSAVN